MYTKVTVLFSIASLSLTALAAHGAPLDALQSQENAAVLSEPASVMPLASIKTSDMPSPAEVYTRAHTTLGYVIESHVDPTGKITKVLVAPAGQRVGKMVPAEDVVVSNGLLMLTIDKMSFDALPDAHALGS